MHAVATRYVSELPASERARLLDLAAAVNEAPDAELGGWSARFAASLRTDPAPVEPDLLLDALGSRGLTSAVPPQH